MQPKRKQHPEIEPDIRPRMNVLQGGGQTTPERGNLSSVPNETANDLGEKERRFGVIQGGGETTPERADLRSVADNIDSVREGEQAGWQTNVSGGQREKVALTLKGWLKKRGPVGVIAALLLGGGVGLGFFGTSLMPITLVEHFTNDLNDLNFSQQLKFRNAFGNKIGGDSKKKAEACKKSASSIACKSGSLKTSEAKRFETDRFEFGNKVEENGRTTFSSFKFPDGSVVNNLQEFDNHMKNSATAWAAFNSVLSLKSAIFTLGDFFKKSLAKVGVSKQKKIEGDTKDEAQKSYEAATKGEKGTVSVSSVGRGDTEEDKKNAEDGNGLAKLINEKITAGQKLQTLPVGRFGSGLAGVSQTACMMYNMASLVSTLAKVRKALSFAAFALIFLSAADSMRAQEATEAEVAKVMEVLSPSEYPSKIEDPETGEMIDNPNIGKNALDAEAYKIVAYGDEGDLTSLAKQFFIASGALGVIEKVINWMNDTFTREGVKTFCQVANNPITGIVSFLASPLFSAAILAISEILPLDKIAAEIVNMAVDAVSGLDLTNGVIGKDAGEVIFIGAAVALGSASKSFGMVPGKFDKIRENMQANHQILQHEVAMAKHKASKTPFDPTNRYSFLGSLAVQVAGVLPNARQTSLTFPMTKILSAFPTSLKMITKNANAAYSMPVADYSQTRFSQCQDEAYLALNISPDMFCAIRYTPFEHVDMNAAIKYMQDHNQITESGDPVPGSYYEKFKKYCSDREEPWGSTTVPAEEQTDGADWYTGKKCIDNTVENQMSSEFTGYKVVLETIDRETTSATTATSPIAGDAKGMALAAANHPNIIWREPTKTQLLKFANGETVYNACNAPMAVSKYLLSALLSNTNKYKISVSNIGFKEDRSDVGCETGTYQHPKGTAVDIASIEVIGGGSTGAINLPANVQIVNQYATDFLAALPRNRGGVGQSEWGVNPVFPPGSVALNGSHLFSDAPNHLHIDARNRENLNDTE